MQFSSTAIYLIKVVQDAPRLSSKMVHTYTLFKN